jgi:peptide deformylase
MAILEVLQMGHPLLRDVARPLEAHEIGDRGFQQLLDDMVDTLHEQGGIGLAAPQIGVSVRVAIIEIEGGPSRYGELASMPLNVFINPVIEVLDPATMGYWEGCLSVAGIRGFVERPQHVRVNYTTATGDSAELELEGFLATVFQHEFDHLDGKLFVDRMTDTSLLSFEPEFERFHS